MNTMITRLYRRGMTIVSNQRGYGLYCQEKDELLFMELQADNDHSADILLQAAREHTGLTNARLLLAENQFLYLGEGLFPPVAVRPCIRETGQFCCLVKEIWNENQSW